MPPSPFSQPRPLPRTGCPTSPTASPPGLRVVEAELAALPALFSPETGPPETGPIWLGVLSDAEGVLTGRLLLPFWRVGEGAGRDLAAPLENPPVIAVAGLLQGAAPLPYLRPRPRASGESIGRFAQMAQGDARLRALILN